MKSRHCFASHVAFFTCALVAACGEGDLARDDAQTANSGPDPSPAIAPTQAVPGPEVVPGPDTTPSGTTPETGPETPIGTPTPAPDPSTPTPTPEPEGPTPVSVHGQLSVVAGALQDAGGQVVQLRGQAFAWDNWWPQYYNAGAVSWLRDDWCVDIVRASMGIEPDGAYLQNPQASKARIQTVVDAAIERGLYVIIDWHAHDLHQDEALAFFDEMAMTYGDKPNVLYEVFNEPDYESWPEVKAYAETIIAAIRQHDPDNLVIVGTPEWDQRIDLAAADPITSDPNILYAVHFYAATHGDWLRDRTQAAIDDGMAIIVSESGGSEASGQGANDYDEWQAWFAFMDERNLSWVNWSISDKAGETVSVLEPGAPASGGWDASTLTETGEYIRDVFRAHCD